MAADRQSSPGSLSQPFPFITVMMPAYNEEAYIRESLLSLISTGYPQDRMEIIVADGQSTDRTREEVAKVTEQYPFVRLIDNPQKLQSAGCNRAAAEASPQSEYFIRVDAHSKWSENFLPLCIQTAQKTGADLVVFVNSPVGVTPFQKALAYALQHPLGVGNSLYRLGRYSGWVDHGQHGCFKRSIWKESGGYDPSFPNWPNEDVYLSYTISRQRGKIWLEKDLKMMYFPRKDIVALAVQYFKYGYGRFKTFSAMRESLSMRQLIPVFFVWALLFSGFLFLLGTSVAFVCLFFTYFTLIIFVALMTCFHKKDFVFLRLCKIFPTIHFSWGLGFSAAMLHGLLMIKPKK